jgi:hypothetical protein
MRAAAKPIIEPMSAVTTPENRIILKFIASFLADL